MKLYFTLFIVLIFSLSSHSQDNIFVLVDVSRSVSQNQLSSAKQELINLLTSGTLTNANIHGGRISDLQSIKMKPGDKLAINTFGDLSTTIKITPKPDQINDNTDVERIVQTIQWIPTDGKTYITLAKAKIAEYAKKHNIRNYKLYIFSDNRHDDYGQGNTPYYPDYTRKLVDGYNTSTNPAVEGSSTNLKFSPNSEYMLTFIHNVDVSGYTPPTQSQTQQPIQQNEVIILLNTFANGSRNNPIPTKNKSFTVSWNCKNCPEMVKYNVRLTEIGGGNYRDKKLNVNSNQVVFNNVPSGKFKINVTAINTKGDTTYVKTPSGGLGWILFFLIIILVGLGYYYWNKKRNEKIDTNRNNQFFLNF